MAFVTMVGAAVLEVARKGTELDGMIAGFDVRPDKISEMEKLRIMQNVGVV